MKMTRENIVDDKNIVGHIVLGSAKDAVHKIAKDLDIKNEIEVKLMYGEMELDLDGFIEHWQSQIDEMILDKAEELIDEKLSDPIQDLEDICRQAGDTIKEKIGIKPFEW